MLPKVLIQLMKNRISG